jgi:hypothetical protein
MYNITTCSSISLGLFGEVDTTFSHLSFSIMRPVFRPQLAQTQLILLPRIVMGCLFSFFPLHSQQGKEKLAPSRAQGSRKSRASHTQPDPPCTYPEAGMRIESRWVELQPIEDYFKYRVLWKADSEDRVAALEELGNKSPMS